MKLSTDELQNIKNAFDNLEKALNFINKISLGYFNSFFTYGNTLKKCSESIYNESIDVTKINQQQNLCILTEISKNIEKTGLNLTNNTKDAVGKYTNFYYSNEQQLKQFKEGQYLFGKTLVENYIEFEKEILLSKKNYEKFAYKSENLLENYKNALENKQAYNISELDQLAKQIEENLSEMLKCENIYKNFIASFNSLKIKTFNQFREIILDFKQLHKNSVQLMFETILEANKDNFSLIEKIEEDLKSRTNSIGKIEIYLSLPGPKSTKEAIFPDYIENPEKLKNYSLNQFNLYYNSFTENTFKLLNERLMIVKVIRKLLGDFFQANSYFAKEFNKILNISDKNSIKNIGFEYFNKAAEGFLNIANIFEQKFKEFSEIISRKLRNFDKSITNIENFIKINMEKLDNFHLEFREEFKPFIKAKTINLEKEKITKNQSLLELNKNEIISPTANKKRNLSENSELYKNIINEMVEFEIKNQVQIQEILKELLSNFENIFFELKEFQLMMNNSVFTEIKELFYEEMSEKNVLLLISEIFGKEYESFLTNPILNEFKEILNIKENQIEGLFAKNSMQTISLSIKLQNLIIRRYNLSEELEINEEKLLLDKEKSMKELTSPKAKASLEINKGINNNINHLKKHFKLTEDEEIKGSFLCSLVEKIQVAGKIYFSNHKIYFYSSFNQVNILFDKTTIAIPKNEIISIQKKKYLFDNSISIVTLKGEIHFTAFVMRNKAYKLANSLYFPEKFNQEELEKNNKSSIEENVPIIENKESVEKKNEDNKLMKKEEIIEGKKWIK